jgi:hypothetical protein
MVNSIQKGLLMAAAKVASRVATQSSNSSAPPKPEPEILFQKYFKSVGTRTYAAQVKKANNGNHFILLTEGKRDEKTGDVRKNKLLVFSEDFTEFFRMLQETVQFIKANPVPEEIKTRQQKYWAKKASSSAS